MKRISLSKLDNSHLLLPTIERGEDIFNQLNDFKTEYNDWILPAQVRVSSVSLGSHLAKGSFVDTLGKVDTDKIFSMLVDVTDFENALRQIKLKGKELERLPNERRVGCVTVSVQDRID